MSKGNVGSRRSHVHVIPERCKACGFCIEFCPKGIIHRATETNSEGYHPVYIKDSDECTGCGICSMICPDFAIYVVSEKEKKRR